MSLLSSTRSSEPSVPAVSGGLRLRLLRAWRWWLLPIVIVLILWVAAMTFAHRSDDGQHRTYTVM
jgi:hypothetical protein